MNSIQKMRDDPKPINFRVATFPLQDDNSVLICKVCSSYITLSTITPSCEKFVEEYDILCLFLQSGEN